MFLSLSLCLPVSQKKKKKKEEKDSPVLPSLSGFHPSLPVYGKWGGAEHPWGMSYMQFTENLWLGSGCNLGLCYSLHFSQK